MTPQDTQTLIAGAQALVSAANSLIQNSQVMQASAGATLARIQAEVAEAEHAHAKQQRQYDQDILAVITDVEHETEKLEAALEK